MTAEERQTSSRQEQKFERVSITVPAELVPFVKAQAGHPRHAGNLSSYIRSLILDDQKHATQHEG